MASDEGRYVRRTARTSGLKMLTPNPRAVVGNNSGAELGEFARPVVDENALRGVLRRIATAYNTAAAHKRDATERLRDIQRDEKAKQSEYFRGLEAARQGAIDRLKQEFRKREDFRAAEDDKADAASRQREAIKEAKVHGIDTDALKTALKMQNKMDVHERREHFDNVDIYAKVLGLWNDGE